MPNAKAIADAVAVHFGGKATPSPASSGNEDSDSEAANSAFHSDLNNTICPDCHSAVKKVMYGPGPEPTQDEILSNYAKEKAAQAAAKANE